MFTVRRLGPSDAASFVALRLQGLQEAPTAFGASFEEECDRPVSAVAERIANNTEGFILGAFEGGALVGVVGMQRERPRKRAHKMVLWGMYVTPPARGKGFGRKLVDEALRLGFTMSGVRQVILGVNAANAPALALYRAAGFTAFGVERACMIVDGIPQDEVHMVRVRHEG